MSMETFGCMKHIYYNVGLKTKTLKILNAVTKIIEEAMNIRLRKA